MDAPGTTFAYFGYGSLVNRDTLHPGHGTRHHARLAGWRRHWQCRGLDVVPATGEDIALLSVHRAQGSNLDGMVVIDDMRHLPALDQREAHYDRVVIDRCDLDFQGGEPAHLPDTIHVYVGRPASTEGRDPVLLQSYLDAVMSGFLHEFGESGLDDFLDSTLGFDRKMRCDRRSPVYSRAVQIESSMAARFDARLRALGVEFLD